jgi:hypothetical protein
MDWELAHELASLRASRNAGTIMSLKKYLEF